jgi:hypothetical protein
LGHQTQINSNLDHLPLPLFLLWPVPQLSFLFVTMGKGSFFVHSFHSILLHQAGGDEKTKARRMWVTGEGRRMLLASLGQQNGRHNGHPSNGRGKADGTGFM